RAHLLVCHRVRAFCANGIAVEADHSRGRDRRAHLFFDTLRPPAELADPRAAACRTALGPATLAAAAPMAHQRGVCVERVRNVAGRTLDDVPAVAAEHDGREAAAVQEKDRLLASADRFDKGRSQCGRERAAVTASELETQ